MLNINLDDVINVLNACKVHLIALAVIFVLSIAVMVGVRKKTKSKKFLVRGEAALSLVVGIAIIVNLILTGPLYNLVSLATGEGDISKETHAAANELATQIADEGIVLLKNDNNNLPMAPGDNVNVFGWASVSPYYSGSGSGAMNDIFPVVSLLDGLRNAGLNPNQELVDFYTKYKEQRPVASMGADMTLTLDWLLPEPGADMYTSELMDNAKAYSDSALIVLARGGGEGNDLPTDMYSLASGIAPDAGAVGFNMVQCYDESFNEGADWDAGDTYLDLSNQEEAMIELVCQNFDNVTVIYNGANTLEMGFVNEYPQIKSVLWCPPTGQTGFDGLGHIIAGTVNPSAKTSDTFIYDLTKAPTWNNFGMMRYTNTSEFEEGGTQPSFVNYVENIYVGYKFYETAADEGLIDYDKVVQYPFGYGLSYTNFTQEMGEITEENGVISFDVTVTNTGSVAGKDVVQVYYNPPYINGGIEKATANLVAFKKTNMIEPGKSEVVSIEFNLEDMASFDDREEMAYVLDAGDYIISINSDAHTVIKSQTYSVPSKIVYSGENKRSTDQIAATNLLDYARGENVTYLSRADHFANYAEATAAPVTYEMSDETKATFYNIANYNPDVDDDPNAEAPVMGAEGNVQLVELRGLDYDDPKWDSLLDQMTVDEMNTLISTSGFQTPNIQSIGKVRTTDCDGPSAINNNFTGKGSIGFPAGVMISNTWNVDLAYAFGDHIGQMADELNVSGWYAPAMNIHRSAFAGRNFEYYSEDGLLSGKMAANAVHGAADHGVYAYIKHYAVNDQETNRCGMLCTWSTEQAVREIYLKPFEYAVKEGNATAVMSALNYLGNRWVSGTNEMCNIILRDEWGFHGMVLTDYFGVYGYMNADQAVRNGNDAMLVSYPTATNAVGSLSGGEISNSGLQAMRKATHNILYTVVNSRSYAAETLNPGMPNWQKLMVGIDVVLGLAVVAGAIAIYKKSKRIAD